jgi:hypothetical protein
LFITSRRSAGRGLGRKSAVYPAFIWPFLSHFWAVSRPKWPKNWVFEVQKRLKHHRQRRTRWPQHHTRVEMARQWAGVMLRPTGAPLAVIFWAFLDLKKPF